MAAGEDLYPGLLLDADEVGALLFAERLWPAPLFVLGWLAVLGAVAGALVPSQGPEAFGGPVGGLLLLGALVAGAARTTVRVHARALVVDVRRPFAATYVVPWTTVDPAHVRLHRSANFLGRRTGAHGTRERRVDLWHRTAVSVVGLTGDYASADRRTSRLEDVRRQVAQRRDEPLMPLPVTPWYLGTRHEEALLHALEQALVRAGRQGAEGLAERCLSEPVRERWPTPLTEEQVYGGALPRRLPG